MYLFELHYYYEHTHDQWAQGTFSRSLTKSQSASVYVCGFLNYRSNNYMRNSEYVVLDIHIFHMFVFPLRCCCVIFSSLLFILTVRAFLVYVSIFPSHPLSLFLSLCVCVCVFCCCRCCYIGIFAFGYVFIVAPNFI